MSKATFSTVKLNSYSCARADRVHVEDVVDGDHLTHLHELLDDLGGLHRELRRQLADRHRVAHLHDALGRLGDGDLRADPRLAPLAGAAQATAGRVVEAALLVAVIGDTAALAALAILAGAGLVAAVRHGDVREVRHAGTAGATWAAEVTTARRARSTGTARATHTAGAARASGTAGAAHAAGAARASGTGRATHRGAPKGRTLISTLAALEHRGVDAAHDLHVALAVVHRRAARRVDRRRGGVVRLGATLFPVLGSGGRAQLGRRRRRGARVVRGLRARRPHVDDLAHQRRVLGGGGRLVRGGRCGLRRLGLHDRGRSHGRGLGLDGSLAGGPWGGACDAAADRRRLGRLGCGDRDGSVRARRGRLLAAAAPDHGLLDPLLGHLARRVVPQRGAHVRGILLGQLCEMVLDVDSQRMAPRLDHRVIQAQFLG
jgi:hypothetical protein